MSHLLAFLHSISEDVLRVIHRYSLFSRFLIPSPEGARFVVVLETNENGKITRYFRYLTIERTKVYKDGNKEVFFKHNGHGATSILHRVNLNQFVFRSNNQVRYPLLRMYDVEKLPSFERKIIHELTRAENKRFSTLDDIEKIKRHCKYLSSMTGSDLSPAQEEEYFRLKLLHDKYYENLATINELNEEEFLGYLFTVS
jgi:hypothetical protein